MTAKPSSNDDIRRAYEAIRERVERAAAEAGRRAGEIQIMAVTKTRTAEEVNAAIGAGVRLLGENRAQELLERHPHYRLEGCGLHFIGGLQTNKVRQIVDKVDMIESVDSLRLANEIDRQCRMRGKVMDILLQVNIGEEATKGGFPPAEVLPAAEEICRLPGVRIMGLMAIPPYSEDILEAHRYFEAMRQMSVDIGSKKLDNVNIAHLSMGMSYDYEAAIAHGATIIRVGRALFGQRS